MTGDGWISRRPPLSLEGRRYIGTMSQPFEPVFARLRELLRKHAESFAVSYHLMGVSGNPRLLDGISQELRARMQGKSCFNFKAVEDALFQEVDRLTIESLTGMRKAGYVSDQQLGRGC